MSNHLSNFDFNDYTRNTKRLGSNEGGLFTHKETKKEYYINPSSGFFNVQIVKAVASSGMNMAM